MNGILATFLVYLYTMCTCSTFSAVTQSVPPPPSSAAPAITLSVYPGHTLWSGESLILECKVSTARHRRPGTSAVWHRALLDPAGRRLRARNNHNSHNRRRPKTTSSRLGLVVRERTAELISHGQMLLLSDDRFSVEVKRYEDGVVYRLQVILKLRHRFPKHNTNLLVSLRM